jgi:hypothetical protein
VCDEASHKHLYVSSYTAANDTALRRNHRRSFVAFVLSVSVLLVWEGTFCSVSSPHAILSNGNFWLETGCRSNPAHLAFSRLVREWRIAACIPHNTLRAEDYFESLIFFVGVVEKLLVQHWREGFRNQRAEGAIGCIDNSADITKGYVPVRS